VLVVIIEARKAKLCVNFFATMMLFSHWWSNANGMWICLEEESNATNHCHIGGERTSGSTSLKDPL
jgi:hypothetical protein